MAPQLKIAVQKASVIGLLSLLAGLLSLRLVEAAPGAQVNEIGLSVAGACVGTGAMGTAAPIDTGNSAPKGATAWLNARRAHCQGDDQAEQAAVAQAVAGAPFRLPMISLAAPQDVALARAAVAAHPEQGSAHIWLAQGLAQAGDADGAISEYVTGLELTPNNADAWEELGHLYDSKGLLAQSAAAYDHACHYVDHGKQGCVFSGQTYLKLGLYEQAAQEFAESIQQLGNSAADDAERGLVTALLALGKTQEAIPHLRILAQHGSPGAQETLLKLEAGSK